jgi:hypothetical protein
MRRNGAEGKVGMIRVENRKTWRGEGHWVGRPSPLGNPYSHVCGTTAEFKVATRDEAVEKYREWLFKRLDGDNPATRMFVSLLDEYEVKGELILVCSCKPERCHAEIIRDFIEECVAKAAC